MSSASSFDITGGPRWLAYDDDTNAASAKPDDNVELEPGNGQRNEVAWSEIKSESYEGCCWQGWNANSGAPSSSESRKFSLPYRVLTTTLDQNAAAEHCVSFLPRSYLSPSPSFSSPTVASLHSHCRSTVESLAARVLASDSLTSDRYTHFRFMWMLIRDNQLLHSASTAQSLLSNTNLYAPIVTHDQKSFIARVLQKVLPSTDSTHQDPLQSPSSYAQSLQRRQAGLLPETPFACDINDPDAMMIELLQSAVHATYCLQANVDIDARKWVATQPETTWIEKFQNDYSKAAETFFEWGQQQINAYRLYFDLLARCYRELMPPRVFMQLLSHGLPFAFTDPLAQSGLVRYVLEDKVVREFPAAFEYRLELWKGINEAIEKEGTIEVHERILKEVQSLIASRSSIDATQPQPTHWTVTYRDQQAASPSTASSSSTDAPSSSLRTLTLRLDSGFSSTTGCSLWPAGMLMCDFILANRNLFAGKRVLELGVGIGLTTLMLHRIGVAALICTDCDEKALRNLRRNFEINQISVHDEEVSNGSAGIYETGVHVIQLDWTSPTREQVLSKCEADIVIACDTIYLPDFQQAQGEVVKMALQGCKSPSTSTHMVIADTSSSSSSSSATSSPCSLPCAFFAQMKRNPETFASYISTFTQLGMTDQALDLSKLPTQFAYERDAIMFNRWTLNQ